ncbi:MAG: recombinase family protein, partial [Streptosporangiales bacterium]
RDRSRRAREQAARQGRRVGGHRPFGYERDGVTVKEEEAAAIRKACSDVLAGVPLTAVGRAWNEAGLLSGRRRRKGERPGSLTEWSTTTVRQVLTNPRNAGLRAYKGEIVARAQWPAILDEDTYHAVMRYLSDPSRQVGTRSGQANQRLLTGVALCAECGMTVHSARARSGNPLYRCRSEYHVNRKAEPVEAYVSDLVIERLSRDDARELLTDVSKPDVDALRARAQMVRRRIDDLAAEYAADEECVMTASQMRTATGKLKAKLATVESEMADAGRVDALGPLLSSDDIASAWGMLSTARRRSVIDLLMTIRLHRTGRGVRTFRPESVEIEWKV